MNNRQSLDLNSRSGTNQSLGVSPSSFPSIPSPELPELPIQVNADLNTALPKSSSELLNEESIIKVLNSDAALDALLKRLKESINCCEEFAKFIKKKSGFQEDYGYQVRKLAKNTQEYLKHNASNIRQDSFSKSFEQIVNFDDRLHNVGAAYVTALQQMSDELFHLSATMNRQRRLLKDEGKRKEKDVADSVIAAEKAKIKYDNLCQDLDRVRTNEPTKKFTLKGAKSTSQQEEELLAKIETAQSDYNVKVTQAKRQKEDLTNSARPQNLKTLKDLILELDLAMSVQLQKYTTWCENLLMNSGVLISPLRADARKSSMKTLAASVDNERDLYNYLMKYLRAGSSKGLQPVDFVIHPTLSNTQSNYNANYNNNTNTNLNTSTIKRSSSIILKKQSTSSPLISTTSPGLLNVKEESHPNSSNRYSYIAGSQANRDPFGNSNTSSVGNPSAASETFGSDNYVANSTSHSALPSTAELTNIIKNHPRPASDPLIFGGSIDALCLYEEESVPFIVKQCINIIDTYGIKLEGIYRTSGNSAKVHLLKDALNNDRSLMDKLIANPEKRIDSDFYCIASLLKLYFAQLSEPLLTNLLYPRFVASVKIRNPGSRLKSLHECVFAMPDANYFTLRAVIFHLNRIVESEAYTRMTPQGLGIIWGPNLLPSDQATAEDINLQGQIVTELMKCATDIFVPENGE